MRRLEFTVSEADGGRQIRDFLRGFGVSSSLLKKLKSSEGGITLNGKAARTVDVMHTGDVLAVILREDGSTPERLADSGAEYVYSDDDILILNKPAHMPVHESRNHRGDTLANAAACFLEDGTAFRAVYRLDRDTSGLVIIAKNTLAASKLSGRVEKVYYAVCSGILNGSGTVDMPIDRLEESIITRGVTENGDRAVTHWQSLETFGDRTLLRLRLETGRTHQIRVHLSYTGHPLLGDSLYGGDCTLIDRQALHCKTVSFIHPVSGKEIKADSDFPADFAALLK